MSGQGGHFHSLEALRKHWSTRASSKRKQVEETSRTKEAIPNGTSLTGGTVRDYQNTASEARLSESSPVGVLDSQFGQLWLRDDASQERAVESAPENSREARYSDESDHERDFHDGAAEDGQAKGVAAAASRHPPSLSVMRPLGDFNTLLEPSIASSEETTPRGVSEESLNRGRRRAHSARPPPSATAAAATAWRQQQTYQHHQSSGVAGLASQIIQAVGPQEKEQAILKLYAVLCQSSWVAQQGRNPGWNAGFMGMLELGLPKFLKHTAALVLRRDRGYSDLVRSMAAAILKALTKWIEGQLKSGDSPEALTAVQEALQAILVDAYPANLQNRGNLRDTEDSAAGYGNLLDTDALEGLLDPETAPTTRKAYKKGKAGGNSLTETHHMFGSLMDTGSLEALVSQNRPATRSTSALMGTHMLSSFGSALDTSDITGHMMEHRGALRATIWLFKSDQPDAWYAAASLVGSIALLGSSQIDAMGGPKLVKPLMWVLRNGDAQPKFAAIRALAALSQDIACRTVIARQDKYLRAMARVLQSQDDSSRHMAVSTLNMLLAHDPSTHWVLARSGIVAAFVEVIKQPLGDADIKAEATLGLKHLTSSSQRNRDALLQANGLAHLVSLLRGGNTDAQYNSARILRHLAMGGSSAGKEAAFQAIPALVHSLKVGRPRVCFASAAALAMVTEGQVGACDAIEAEGGIQALVQLLVKGGGQGKKVAAEALQALAAESEDIRPKIAAAGCIRPLIQMLQIGNLQQQAAAAGAVQALAYCPSSANSLANALAGHGVVEPLVAILNSAPRAMRCAAAGSLCNLALRSDAIQAQIVDAGALEALVELLSEAQPDGQYSAAAALMNLAAAGPDTRSLIIEHGALPPLIDMLMSDSWYCRIIAADLLAHLGSDGPLHQQALVSSNTLRALLSLLCLQQSRGTLGEIGSEVAHLAYERSQDVIVMKGYKFARAKVAAAAALGIVVLQSPEVPEAILGEAAIAEELCEMLTVGRSHVRLVAAAAATDLAHISVEARRAFLQGEMCAKLLALLKAGASKSAKHKKGFLAEQPPTVADAAAAAAALTQLVKGNEVASKVVVGQGAVGSLIAVLEQGSQSEAASAAGLLSCLREVSPQARKAVKQAGVEDVIAPYLPGLSPPWVGKGATAQLLQQSMAEQVWGYAITAKPSANLYILLQVPFEALMPAGRLQEQSMVGKRATGRRKELSQAVDSRRKVLQSLREGADSRRRRELDPRMQSVAESGPLEEEPEREEIQRIAIDAEQWASPDPPAWQPQPEPAQGKSRGDILETWTEA